MCCHRPWISLKVIFIKTWWTKIITYWLHLMNISSSNVLFFKQHLLGWNTFPAMLKSLSTGAEDAGIQWMWPCRSWYDSATVLALSLKTTLNILRNIKVPEHNWRGLLLAAITINLLQNKQSVSQQKLETKVLDFKIELVLTAVSCNLIVINR